MSDNMKVSVLCVTRRANRVGESIKSLYDLANDKKSVECLVWIDDDDSETHEVLKNLKKEIVNLRLFVCPRVGFSNMGFVFEHMIKASRSEVLFPWADDFTMTTTGWDEKMSRYSDEAAIIGMHTRFGFTKKLLEKHDIVGIVKDHTQNGNEYIQSYGQRHNLYKPVEEGATSKCWFKVDRLKRIERVNISLEDIEADFDILKYEV
jgi:hypothetical protein